MTPSPEATPFQPDPSERIGAVRLGLRRLRSTPNAREVVAAAGVAVDLAEIAAAWHELGAILAAPPRPDAPAD